ncbi:CoA transferase subunit A [Halogeometricum sp. CBA1124]|uniref:CoA transferase subunit A n=1 Tax=Halogeometricum sp. CBA1124 TaxID=2668071 RepID=UPI00142BDBE3|nr:CoA-transferase [Halogeometricum sp. CBA1124]MUV56199.1 CoA transferase subunit A [Halogeometricum sp. CBA1124]
MTKETDTNTAIAEAVDDGDSVYLGGFTHLIPFASGHEMIRQGYEDLHLIRATPDLVLDQMIAAGCASAVTFSWAGNPGVGSLRAFRRAVEDGVPNEIDIDEYSHFGLVSRLFAGARDMPFVPVRTFLGSSLPEHNERIRTVANPYEPDDEVAVVPPLRPDVAIVRAQRASPEGDAHLWGITGDVVDAAFAAETVVLSVEEVVDTETLRSDPNRTEIPGTIVDYVVEEPYGSHPSYTQGYYGRDNEAYIDWNDVSETHESTLEWLSEWVHGVDNRREYVEKLGVDRLLDLEPTRDYAEPIDVGRYA